MPIISSCPSRNVSLAQVMILEKSGDGWWRGQYGNKVFFYWPVWQQGVCNETNPCVFFKSQVGWFPSNYTQEEIDDPHTYCMAENVLDVMVKLKLPNQLPSGIVIPHR